jgi:hypothetical protein
MAEFTTMSTSWTQYLELPSVVFSSVLNHNHALFPLNTMFLFCTTFPATRISNNTFLLFGINVDVGFFL